jgi:hypothetical protein
MNQITFDEFNFKEAISEIGGIMAFAFILFGACLSFIFPCLFMNHLSQFFIN